MGMEVLINFIRPELLILIAVLWCFGLFLKRMPWFKDDWAIPFILLLMGIVFTILYLAIILSEGFNRVTILMGIIQGILIAAVAVFFNEAVKQVFIKRPEDKQRE